MKTWLLYHRFAFTNALKRMIAQPASILLNALVIAIALALPAVGYTLLAGVQPVTRDLAADPEVTVYMQLDAARADAEQAMARMRSAAGERLQSVQLVAREAALSNLKAQSDYADVLAALPGNPLPDAIVLRLRAGEGTADAAERLADTFRAIPKVERVQIDSDWVRRLEAALRFLSAGLSMLAIAVGVAVVAVAFNTIRLQALTQREEVEVSNLMGATRGFIRRPFLYLGAMQGVLGGLLATALVAAAWWPLSEALADLARAYHSNFRLPLPGAGEAALFLFVSLALGWLGAALSLRHHVQSAA